MGKYLIGIDIGTSSVKSIICNSQNYQVISSYSIEHNLFSPFPGWAEESPEEWWQNTIKTLICCIQKSGVDPKSIAAIGTTGMVPAFVQLDKNGNPIRNSIQQNDARTYKEIEIIKKRIDEESFFNITGCSLNQQMIAPKILWMLNNEPEKFKEVCVVLGSYDYINYKLTGKFSLESNWALESGLFDIVSHNWSEKILKIIGIKENLFPNVNNPTNIIGGLKKEVAEKIGLKPKIPVIAGVADHISSAFISGIKDPGDMLIKLGSAGDIIFSADHLVKDKRLLIDYHLIPGHYYLNGCMATSGSLIKWFKQQFIESKEFDYAKMDKEADRIISGSNGIVILPYFIGEKTPIFNPIAKGVIFGLTTFHTKFHIYRAILESIGYAFLHHIDVFKEIGFEPKKITASGAGASSLIWVQIISNIIGYEINLLEQNLSSSLGASFIAGIASNCYRDLNDANNFVNIYKTIKPDLEENIKYRGFYKIYRNLYKDLKEEFQELNSVLQ